MNRVELKAIDPPHSVQDSMEKQMRAERDRRAAILNAEGVKQSQILTAEGDQQSSILRAEGQAQAAHPRAQGEARAIQRCSTAIHKANPDRSSSPTSTCRCSRRSRRGREQGLDRPDRAHRALGGIGQGLSGGRGAGMGDVLRASLGLRENGHVADSGADDAANAVDFGESALEDPRAALERARAEAAVAVADAEGESRRSGASGSHVLPENRRPPEIGHLQ